LIDESLVVGSDGGIQNIIVFMRNNPTRVHADFEQLAATPAVLDNVKCVFRPHVLTVWTKQKLLLKNSDNVGHNTNFTSAKQGFNASLAAGVEQDRTFKYSESSPSSVSCNIHPWMAAKMLIRDNPYFAVTKADGSFEIPNMPAGEKIEIQLWHELNPQLEMQANDAKIAKGRFTLTLAENETKTLELKLNSTLLPIK
jgi:plastocyanin